MQAKTYTATFWRILWSYYLRSQKKKIQLLQLSPTHRAYPILLISRLLFSQNACLNVYTTWDQNTHFTFFAFFLQFTICFPCIPAPNAIRKWLTFRMFFLSADFLQISAIKTNCNCSEVIFLSFCVYLVFLCNTCLFPPNWVLLLISYQICLPLYLGKVPKRGALKTIIQSLEGVTIDLPIFCRGIQSVSVKIREGR